jgi:hypothetical protein
VKKVVYVIGILASLLAAEGLYRFGSFVSAMDGADSPFYMLMLLVSIACVVLFILAWVGKLPKVVKWIGIALVVASIALMMFAPAFPVNIQIIGSLIVTFICLIFANTKKSAPKQEAAK